MIGVGMVALIAGYTSLALSETVIQFALAATLLGVGNGNTLSTIQAMSISLVPADRRGVASSTLFSSMDVGIGMGSILLGWVAEATTLSTMFLVSGGVILVPLAYFFLYVRQYYAREVQLPSAGRTA